MLPDRTFRETLEIDGVAHRRGHQELLALGVTILPCLVNGGVHRLLVL